VNDIVDRGGATASGRSVVLIYASSLASSAIEVISGSRAGFNLTGQIDVIDDQGGLRLGRSLDPPPNTNCQTPIHGETGDEKTHGLLERQPAIHAARDPLGLVGHRHGCRFCRARERPAAPRWAGAIPAARSNLFEPIRSARAAGIAAMMACCCSESSFATPLVISD